MKILKRILFYFYPIIFLISCANLKYKIPKDSTSKYDGKLYFATYDSEKHPRDTINHGPNDSLSLFTNKWYSKHLNSMKEPTIFDRKNQNLKIIRFTNLGTWANPFAYRIEKFNDKVILTYSKTNGLGGYQTGKRTKFFTKEISIKKWNEIISKMNEIDFWNIPTQDPNFINDGTEWILEVLLDGKYHLVTRNSPDHYDGKKYAELCELITKL